MIHAQRDRKAAVPLWAAFGAPLVGVPLLVALLALGGPRSTEVPANDPEAEVVTEQIEVEKAEAPFEVAAAREEGLPPRDAEGPWS